LVLGFASFFIRLGFGRNAVTDDRQVNSVRSQVLTRKRREANGRARRRQQLRDGHFPVIVLYIINKVVTDFILSFSCHTFMDINKSGDSLLFFSSPFRGLSRGALLPLGITDAVPAVPSGAALSARTSLSSTAATSLSVRPVPPIH